MNEWWGNLSTISQVFVLIAIPATLIMIIQSILLFFGLGFDSDVDIDISDDVDVDVDTDFDDASDGLALFTIRGLVAFFAVGGWTGLVASTSGLSSVVSSIIAFIAGTISLFVIAILFKYSLKLQGSGNLQIKNAVGKTGEVYIPIPANQSGTGQITILIQERLVQISAITSDERILKTGEYVTVTKMIDQQTVLVTGQNKIDINNQSQGGISKWIK